MAANVPLPSRPLPRANLGVFAPAAAPPVRIPDGVTVLRGEALAAEQEKRRGAKRAEVKNFRAPAAPPAPIAGVVSDAKPGVAVKAAPSSGWAIRLVLWGGSIVEPTAEQAVDTWAECGVLMRAPRAEHDPRWDLDAAAYDERKDAVKAARKAIWISSEIQAAIVVGPTGKEERFTRAALVAELGEAQHERRDAERERDRIAADHAPRTACQRQRRGGEFPRKAKDFRATFSRGFDGPAAPRTFWPSR